MIHARRAGAPSFDAESINDTIHRALASAGLDTTSGPMRGVTEIIRRALGAEEQANDAAEPSALEPTIDSVGLASETTGRAAEPARPHRNATATGSFTTHEFDGRAGRLSYKVYEPSRPCDAPRPIVVMLHGCTQSADDFAVGTRMNTLAEEHGFIVVYPEQSAQLNPSKCWNWFKPEDQERNAGEPALIAGVVREAAGRHGGDAGRVFVAGMSAGAAMAVVLGETYPELFAGVGAHSGLPYGSAHDVMSAMAAMKGGRSGLPGLQDASRNTAPGRASQPVPIIVFHGDRDHTVQQSNGAEIVRQAVDVYHTREGSSGLSTITRSGAAHGGRKFTRTIHADETGRAHVESWTVHGAGHMWSGGDHRGSYTDSSGPDASAEMVRFFLALPATGSA